MYDPTDLSFLATIELGEALHKLVLPLAPMSPPADASTDAAWNSVLEAFHTGAMQAWSERSLAPTLSCENAFNEVRMMAIPFRAYQTASVRNSFLAGNIKIRYSTERRGYQISMFLRSTFDAGPQPQNKHDRNSWLEAVVKELEQNLRMV